MKSEKSSKRRSGSVIPPVRPIPPDSSTTREAELEHAIHELEVHQEELRIQQNQLNESQRALEDARDRYAQLFDFAPVPYVVLDVHSVIHEANLKAAELLGVERVRLIGRTLTRFATGEARDALLSHLAQCRRRASVATEVLLERTDSSSIPVQLASSPASGAVGSGSLFNTAIIDLSERKRAEAERLQVRERERQLVHDEQLARTASEAKDHFLAMLSHELRTPLTPILFALDAVKIRGGEIPDEIAATMALIRRNVLLETRLIDDLLDMTRIAQGRMSLVPEVVDIRDVIHDVITLCRETVQQKSVSVEVRAEVQRPFVRADPARLRQVLWNLLTNAVRSSREGGTVVVEATNDARWCRIEVIDEGKGIEAEVLPRIFALFEQDPESRRRGVGLGLGLAISKAIVELHGGRIEAYSDGPGKGATFRFRLRTVDPARAEEADSTEATNGPVRQVKVLLVEDNEDSAHAMATFLRLRGYQVCVAGSVTEALELARDADVLISDIALPDGTGHELMRKIGPTRRMRGIALSGYGTAEDKQRSADAGFDRHLVKPVDPAELLAALERLVAA